MFLKQFENAVVRIKNKLTNQTPHIWGNSEEIKNSVFEV